MLRGRKKKFSEINLRNVAHLLKVINPSSRGTCSALLKSLVTKRGEAGVNR